MTVGLICAIPPELGHLLDATTGTRSDEIAHARFTTGRLDGHDVVLVGAGMGKVNAAVVATLLADRFGCRTIVFSGVAGGLDPALHIGDVVIADWVAQHDAGVIEDERLRRRRPRPTAPDSLRCRPFRRSVRAQRSHPRPPAARVRRIGSRDGRRRGGAGL